MSRKHYKKITDAGGVLHHVRYGAMVNLMQDGHVDVVTVFTSTPSAPIITMNVRPGIRLLSIDPDHLDKLLKEKPGFKKTVIPAKTYKNQDYQVTTLGSWCNIFTSSDLSDELVYRITKAIFENIDEIHAVGAQTRLMSVDINYDGNKIPVHPGSKRYYSEKGVRP